MSIVKEDTISAIVVFLNKWCSEGRRQEFMGDLNKLIQTAVKDATSYIDAEQTKPPMM